MTKAKQQSRYQVLKAFLQERRNAIVANLNNRKREIRTARTEIVDRDDSAGEDLQAEISIRLAELQAETLRKVDGALRRLEEGTCGLCSDCDEEIAEVRLRALPFAVRCKGCEESQEQEVEEQRRRVTERSKRMLLVGAAWDAA